MYIHLGAHVTKVTKILYKYSYWNVYNKNKLQLTYRCAGTSDFSNSCVCWILCYKCDTWKATIRCARTCEISDRLVSETTWRTVCTCAVSPANKHTTFLIIIIMITYRFNQPHVYTIIYPSFFPTRVIYYIIIIIIICWV